MCSPEAPHSTSPQMTIRSESGGPTSIQPELFPGASKIVRSIRVDMGPFGEPVRVTAELLPSSVLLLLKNTARTTFVMDGQQVTSLTLADGTVISFA